MTEQSGNEPKRLFDICISLVSDNLDIVDSFEGFPALVGEKIFQRSLTSKKICHLEYATQAVTLFAEAFCEEFLSSLNLTGEHLGINYYHEQITLFKDLVELDVSDCGLGDDHELWAHVSKLYRLERFHLGNNYLTDLGVQKLTLPFRMFERGPTNLREMDLSGNTELTANCLKYLVPFPCLDEVFFCNCAHIKECTHKRWNVKSSSRTNSVSSIETEGWAKSLVEKWIKEAKDRTKSQPLRKSWFYSRPNIESAEIAVINRSVPYHTQCIRCVVAHRRKILIAPELNNPSNLSKPCTIEEDNDLMNIYHMEDTHAKESKKHNTFLSSLSRCEVNTQKHESKGDKCKIPSSHKAFLMSRQKTQNNSKCSQTVSKQGSKKMSQTISKEVKQSTLFEFYNCDNKTINNVDKKQAILEKSMEKDFNANCQHVKIDEKENKTTSAMFTNKKISELKIDEDKNLLGEHNKFLSAYEFHRHLEPCCTHPSNCSCNKEKASHNDGPVRKKRKIVIVRPRSEDSKTDKSVDIVAACKPKPEHGRMKMKQDKASLLSSLDQWI